MIQEISPKKYHVEYRQDIAPDPSSGMMVCSSRGVLVKTGAEAERLPRFSDFTEAGLSFDVLAGKARYLFRVDDDHYFLVPQSIVPDQVLENSFRFVPVGGFRSFASQEEAYVAVTASQFWRFYSTRRYCGRCGTENVHSRTERAMVCPHCGLTEYPKISPAIIVAVLDGDRILLTRYARNASDYRRKALVAGFVEVGETPEDTVRREVFEETGLHVKDIRPYKMQPWSFSDSLMLGFTALLDGSPEIRIDTAELCEAAWYTREEVPENPSMISVGNEMIQAFRNGTLKR